MHRVNRILSDHCFIQGIEKNRCEEEGRTFCHHDFPHLLAVARLAYIFLLEEGAAIPKELAYAAGLLHDISRWEQYRSGVSHSEAGAVEADAILKRAGYSAGERAAICLAIRQHRSPDLLEGLPDPLADALHKADIHARLCWNCSSREECYKSSEMPHRERLEY